MKRSENTYTDAQRGTHMANANRIAGAIFNYRCLVALPIVLLLIAGIYMKAAENKQWMVEVESRATKNNSSSECNLFRGRWVFNNQSYPLYKERKCLFLADEFACEKYGRKDLKYQNWRWQPHQCDLPRFNATILLNRLRGKRLVFVGDSLNRNQWDSLVCLVESSIPSTSKSRQITGNLFTFKAIEYNVSIDFYWSPLLVESNSDDPVSHSLPDRIVRVQAIEKHARHWTDADIIIFNTYLWWLRPKMKVLWGSFESPDGIYKEIDMLRSYEMALKTWSDWLEINVNRTRTKLYFISMSPAHLRGDEWGTSANQNCYKETEPIFQKGYLESETNQKMMRKVDSAIQELKSRDVEVQLLNITQLSEYRKDAHPSIYRKRRVAITEDQLFNPRSYADCAHWCLPGVPDTWNEILYAYIIQYGGMCRN
ncbi:protein trichome birefringence-like 34 [Olea europaea var. sylvestris]|uniref:protein trichome birefringence-like 34 n=1 Tax=Olea europaea var. sylvestris TaxID=158386 RepID=UPI000C1D749A|nr:protein trichome birefringence-like 34 [Olea europaea var. sylvestris]